MIWILILPVLALTAWLLVVTVERIAKDDKPVPEFLPGDGSPDPHPATEPPRTEPSMPDGDSLQPALSLVGTVVASDPRWSRASLTSEASGEGGPDRGKTRVYRVGDRLPDQATLVAILDDRVVLDRDGVREELLLQESSGKPERTQPEKPQLADDLVKSTGADRYRVDREELMELLEKADDLLRQARISLSFGADGGIQGVRLSMLDSGTAFEKIGLVNGDVIHRIGSLVIDHPDKLGELTDLLKNVRELDVELSRDEELKTLRYFID